MTFNAGWAIGLNGNAASTRAGGLVSRISEPLLLILASGCLSQGGGCAVAGHAPEVVDTGSSTAQRGDKRWWSSGDKESAFTTMFTKYQSNRTAVRDEPRRSAHPSACHVRRADNDAASLLPARRARRRPAAATRDRRDRPGSAISICRREHVRRTNFYPLGHVTMEVNPKRHERLAALPSMAGLHPLQDDSSCQGMLEIMWQMQNILQEISGLDANLAAAGGRPLQGELTALLIAAPIFATRVKNDPRADPRRRPRHQSAKRRHRGFRMRCRSRATTRGWSISRR